MMGSLSYREVIPAYDNQEEWNEIILNTGGTHSTLQDIKVAEKAGGYCFKNASLNFNRNRYIYWRSYQDVLELSEISLDYNLQNNNLRYKFSDSPVLAISITEQSKHVVLLVSTVCSVHSITYPHPDTINDANTSSWSKGDFHNLQMPSIFKAANASTGHDSSTYYVIENQMGASNNHMPHAACCYLSPLDDGEAYFAMACQTQLMLYAMNCTTGHTVSHQLKEQNRMPRLLSNLKGALIGKNDPSDAEYANSLTFAFYNENIYLLALYRNDTLRVWSTSNWQCVCTISCVREGIEQRLQGPQSNILRKINESSYCAFLSHATGSEFVCLEMQKMTLGTGVVSVNLIKRKVIAAPQLDLTDFDVCESRIWALWSNAEGEFSISSYSLMPGVGLNWVSAAMEPPPDRYSLGIEQGMDPSQAYCSYIFHPGKFSKNVILKALFMFCRSTVMFDSKYCTMNSLKDYVCQTIEDEIQNEIKDYDTSDDDYLEVATRLWERFYTCCEQYHMKATQPTGLLILPHMNGVCVIKKNTFTLLRPCEILEHIMLAGDCTDLEFLLQTHFADNQSNGRNLVRLVIILAQLDKWLPEELKIDLDRKLYQLENPDILIEKITTDIINADGETKSMLSTKYINSLRENLQTLRDLQATIELLLESLRMDNGNPETMQANTELAAYNRYRMTLGNLFCSHLGISVLSETVRQTALIRFVVCRNLLLLLQMLISTKSLSMDILEIFRSQFMPDVVIFLQSYYVMVWIAETPVMKPVTAAMENSVQRLHLLQLTNGNSYSGIQLYNSPYDRYLTSTLLQVFLKAIGLSSALALFADNFQTAHNDPWNKSLMTLSTIVSQLIWSVSYNFIFGEWLFGSCQHIIIADYVRLLNNWCEWNIYSRQFILAVSLLECGETHKAYDLFLQAAKGVTKEQFLAEKILKLSSGETPLNQMYNFGNHDQQMSYNNQCTAHYFLKVIQLFEQHNGLDHIIAIAQVAIALLDKNDPQLPMFQSIVFNNHLQLEHYEDAYHSLIYNAELSRRKDCLRQLIITLFNHKRLDLLMQFPYVGLHEEFENIVESRARSQTMEHNEVYDFLYSFHVKNGNMRKASAILYEQAMRYQLESDSLEALQKRFNSLLMCLNTLHLIDERYRWIAKPVIGDEYDNEQQGENPKNNLRCTTDDGDDIELLSKECRPSSKTQVVVLEIKDIKRELLHTEALINLANQRRDVDSFLDAGPMELAMILSSCGLFTKALRLCNGFNISPLSIFDSLTGACVRILDETPSESWAWLQENDLADLHHRNKASDMAWSLLQKLVRDHEQPESTQIKKTVVNKLLSLNAFVPQWLYNDYKLANCSEFLYLFVKHNRLLEAAELAEEMLSAMLGAGSEYFSFKHPVTVSNRELCMPLNTLDLLLHGLQLNANDIEYKQAHTELLEKIHKYIETTKRTAQDKVQISYLNDKEERNLQY